MSSWLIVDCTVDISLSIFLILCAFCFVLMKDWNHIKIRTEFISKSYQNQNWIHIKIISKSKQNHIKIISKSVWLSVQIYHRIIPLIYYWMFQANYKFLRFELTTWSRPTILCTFTWSSLGVPTKYSTLINGANWRLPYVHVYLSAPATLSINPLYSYKV